MSYEVWQSGYRGRTLNRRHVYRHRWQAVLRALLIRLAYPADSVYGKTEIRETDAA